MEADWSCICSFHCAAIKILQNFKSEHKSVVGGLLGFEISRGTVDRLIREAGRSAELVEPKLLEDIENAALVCADETSWKIFGVLYWLWVLRATYTVYFLSARGAAKH